MNQLSVNKIFGTSVLLVCIAALLAGTSELSAAEEFDITGDWKIKIDYDDRESIATLSISKNPDGSITGKWGENELSDMKFENNKLSFVRIRTWRDREFKATFEGTIKDGDLVGTLSSERGEFPATISRVKPKPTVLGEWDIKVQMREREFTSKLSISQTPDGKLVGKWTSERGEDTISDVKFEDGKLTFTRKSTFGDREWESTFEGTIKGHELTGKFKTERGEMTVTGKRIGIELIGKWELTTTSERGTRTSTLVVDGDMTATYQTGFGEVPVSDLKLEGNKVTFKITMGFGERQFEMEFKGKLEGNTLDGEFISERGTRQVTGKKIVPELKEKKTETKEEENKGDIE